MMHAASPTTSLNSTKFSAPHAGNKRRPTAAAADPTATMSGGVPPLFKRSRPVVWDSVPPTIPVIPVPQRPVLRPALPVIPAAAAATIGADSRPAAPPSPVSAAAPPHNSLSTRVLPAADAHHGPGSSASSSSSSSNGPNTQCVGNWPTTNTTTTTTTVSTTATTSSASNITITNTITITNPVTSPSPTPTPTPNTHPHPNTNTNTVTNSGTGKATGTYRDYRSPVTGSGDEPSLGSTKNDHPRSRSSSPSLPHPLLSTGATGSAHETEYEDEEGVEYGNAVYTGGQQYYHEDGDGNEGEDGDGAGDGDGDGDVEEPNYGVVYPVQYTGPYYSPASTGAYGTSAPVMYPPPSNVQSPPTKVRRDRPLRIKALLKLAGIVQRRMPTSSKRHTLNLPKLPGSLPREKASRSIFLPDESIFGPFARVVVAPPEKIAQLRKQSNDASGDPIDYTQFYTIPTNEGLCIAVVKHNEGTGALPPVMLENADSRISSGTMNLCVHTLSENSEWTSTTITVPPVALLPPRPVTYQPVYFTPVLYPSFPPGVYYAPPSTPDNNTTSDADEQDTPPSDT